MFLKPIKNIIENTNLPVGKMNKWLESVKYNPCKVCCSMEISAGDSGYNTFNPGEIKCICGNTVRVGDCETLDPLPLLVEAWNIRNPSPEEEIIILENKIKKYESYSKEAKERIKKLKK